MKILVVDKMFYPYLRGSVSGGVELVIKNHTKLLSGRDNYVVHFLCSADSEENPLATTHFTNFTSKSTKSNGKFSRKDHVDLVNTVQSLVENLEIDVLYYNFPLTESAIYKLGALKCKIVYLEHGLPLYGIQSHAQLIKLMRLKLIGASIGFVSHKAKQLWNRESKGMFEDSFVLHNSPFAYDISVEPVTKSFYSLIVSRPDENKNIDKILQYCADTKTKVMWIHPDPVNPKECEYLNKCKSIAAGNDCIEFNQTDRNGVITSMAHAEFIWTSSVESYGLIAIEAGLMGTPVVMVHKWKDHPMTEVLREGKDIFRFDSFKTVDLSVLSAYNSIDTQNYVKEKMSAFTQYQQLDKFINS